MRQPVLLIDDDPLTIEYARSGLEKTGRTVDVARDGLAALEMVQRHSYRVVVLDRMLPKLDGLDVLAALRESDAATPVLVLSAMTAVRERVRGLAYGADDYLTKPFHISELLARVEALERRSRSPLKREENVLICEDLRLDLVERRVTRGSELLRLHGREFALLRVLMERRGQAVARGALLKEIWNYDFDPGTNIIDVHISRLRRKLDDVGTPGLIRSVRGIGYSLGRPAVHRQGAAG